MSTAKLIDVVANLASYDADLTIYVKKPWTCESQAIVAQEPDEGGLPAEAKANGYAYFIEVFNASDFLKGWTTNVARTASTREQCIRLIHYAINDA